MHAIANGFSVVYKQLKFSGVFSNSSKMSNKKGITRLWKI